MRKILCALPKEDVQELVSLMSKQQTFVTLSRIFQSKNESISKLVLKIKETSAEIEDFKNELLIKYNVPYYIDKPMHIDMLEATIYIEEE